MKVSEIIEQLKQNEPKLFARIPDKTAIKLVNAVLQQINAEVTATETGVVRVANLGAFNVKQREIEKDGEKVMSKRVFFKALTPKKQEASE